MRIVAGKYKGRTLNAFEGISVRPTSDKARESLFSILQFKIYGRSFLDLFSGTGAMGIEALSRGAHPVYFNDNSKVSVNLIKENLKKVKVEERVSVTNYDALTLLESISEKFDYVYIDPPYATDLGERALKKVARVLKDDGSAIYESEAPFTGEIKGLKVVDNRKYGRIHLTFFIKE